MNENLQDDQENHSNSKAKKLDKKISTGMKLYRYMSVQEFIKMCEGMHLTYSGILTEDIEGLLTNSIGFCFLGEKTTFVANGMPEDGFELGTYTYTPENCEWFLGGVVSPDILVEFQATDDIDIFERLWNIC